jgi:chemosensory pili system protein ChpC
MGLVRDDVAVIPDMEGIEAELLTLLERQTELDGTADDVDLERVDSAAGSSWGASEG